MPGSNGYSIDPALMELDPIGSQLSYEEDVDDNQEFYFLLNNLQKQAGRKLRPEQINALTLQWNDNQNGYLDRFRQMVLSKMGLLNTINPQEIAHNKLRLDANRVAEGMTNTSKALLLSAINNRRPAIAPIVKKDPVVPTPKPFNENHWLGRAKQFGFNSIDEVKKRLLKNGLTADGMFGSKSEAKMLELQKAAETANNPYAGRMLGTTTRDAQQQVVNNYKASISPSQETPSQNTSSANTIQATVNRAAAKFPRSNNSKKAFFGLADSDAVVNLLGDAWNATKGFMSKAGEYLAGPKEPIQTNAPVYERRNVFMEAGKAVHDTFGNANKHKKGGSINKYQQGGNMNEQELLLAVIGYIMATKKQPKSELEVQVIAQEVAGMKQSNPQQYQQLVQMGQQAQLQLAGAKVAALGSKLNYIRKIKGLCPEGEELVYMKEGGRVCPVCQKKADKAQGGKKLEEKKKNAVSDFKEKRKAVNPNDTVNTKFGPRDLNGKTKYPKYNANKENYDFNTRMRVQEKDEKSGKKVIGSACGSKMKKKK